MANLTVNTKKYGQITLNPIQTLTNELLNCKILIINSVNSKTKRPTDGEHSFKGNDRKSVDGHYASENVSTLLAFWAACPFASRKKRAVLLFALPHCRSFARSPQQVND